MENKKIKTFRDIIVWQKAHWLVLEIYRITNTFPDVEKFGLVSQMRRAVVSVASNLVEGFARKNIRETLHFYNISNASLEELKYQVLISRDINMINEGTYCELEILSQEVGRMLQSWIDSQRINTHLSC